MDRKVKVALAGISGYGDCYLGALLPSERARDFQLVGVVDPMPQRCRRLPELAAREIRLHETMDGLFCDTAVDLMLIVTPTHLHAAQTCLALSHGANVLCEKPVAGTVTDAMRMLELQRTVKGFAAIGYQWSFSEAIQSLKRDIMSGALGRPIRMKAIALFPRPVSYFKRNDWAGRQRTVSGEPVFDSPVNNATAHYLHNLFYLLGRTMDSSATPGFVEAELYRANEIENYDTAAIRCRTDCGVELLFYTSHAIALRHGPKTTCEFENAVVEYDAEQGEFVARFKNGRIISYGQPNLDRHEKIWQAIDSVRTGRPLPCGIRAAMSHALCVAAAQESSGITAFPEHLRRMITVDGDDALMAVEGLDDALIHCYERNCLPSEKAELFWARRGRVVQLDVGVDGARRRAATGAVALHA